MEPNPGQTNFLNCKKQDLNPKKRLENREKINNLKIKKSIQRKIKYNLA